MKERFQIKTSGQRDMHNITAQVQSAVRSHKLQTGTIHVFNIGSTACIGTIEFEPGLQEDLPALLDELAPPSRDYGHERAWHDGNGHSHLQATMIGPGITVPVADGQLVLGTWQQIFHLECDIKPREREIVLTLVGQFAD